MKKTVQIKDCTFEFAFFHKWQKGEKKRSTQKFKDWRLGPWFRLDKIVGRKNFSAPEKWKLINCYNFGFDILIVKFWVSFDKGGKHFKED